MVPRLIESEIANRLFKGKAILIFGPRQCGKTTLVESLLKKLSKRTLYLNGDEFPTRERLEKPGLSKLQSLIGNSEILFIDEAQKINDIGDVIKIITDKIRNVQVIATGSSAFELANRLNEALTGRKYEYLLLPFSFSEMAEYTSVFEEQKCLEHRMIYGSYPEVITKKEEAKEIIKLIAGSYLFKDIFSFDSVRNHSLIEKLIKSIALQIGNEVSINELSRHIGANHKTVEKYLNVLEKAYIIHKLSSLSGNVRNEIRKGKKYYFYDTGIRNAIIGNFNPLSLRTDAGFLWENFIISERIKFNLYNNIDAKYYFWRTKQQQEIDFIEERNGILSAYEFKWNIKAKLNISETFTKNYKINQIGLITPANYIDFIHK
jgi:hypothetical protein